MPDDFGAYDEEVQRRFVSFNRWAHTLWVEMCGPCPHCAALEAYRRELLAAFPQEKHRINQWFGWTECWESLVYTLPQDNPSSGRILPVETWRRLVKMDVESAAAERRRRAVPRGALSLCEHDMAGTLCLYEKE